MIDDGVLHLPILVVDDQESNVMLLKRLLRNDGHTDVHGLTDARDVLPFVTSHQPALLLLDFHMPHIDGVELTEQLNASQSLPYMPVLILTADMSPEARTRALEAGATDFITKPLDPIETRLRIRNALRASQLNRDLADANRNLGRRVQERTAELQLANEELRGLDQMRRDLLSMASHEMRTPLTIIRGFTETWDRRGLPADPDQQAAQAAVVTRNVARLQQLIENFLLGAQIESGAVEPALQPLPLHAVLSGAAAALDTCDRTVSVDAPSDAEVVADPTLLHHVVTNLIGNALKYGEPPVEIRGWQSDRTTYVSVRDHGPGVPADFRERMFERFAQASTGDQRTATGTGLGLWIASQLVELHGGRIRYRDAEPRGAIFEVRLPGPGGSDAQVEAPTGSKQGSSSRGLT